MRTGGRVMNESAKRAIKSIAFMFVFILLGRPDVVAAKSNEKQASFLMMNKHMRLYLMVSQMMWKIYCEQVMSINAVHY